jgi:hypothetical protein
LANSLADCDVLVLDRAIVHQVIRGVNTKSSVLKTMLSLLPKFPSFVEVHELILNEEASREAESKRAIEIALLASCGPQQMLDNPPPAQPPQDRNNNNTNFNNGGYGHGGRNGGRGDDDNSGGHNNYNNAPAWYSPPPPEDHCGGLAGMRRGLGSPTLVFLALTHLSLLLRPISPINPQ